MSAFDNNFPFISSRYQKQSLLQLLQMCILKQKQIMASTMKSYKNKVKSITSDALIMG